MKQEIRLYFPLLSARQLIGGANTAYRQEINKLRSFGRKYVLPNIVNLQFRNYPYKASFLYYTSDEIDIISLLTMTSFILHLLDSSVALQSTDFRVIPQLDIHLETKKISLFEREGCLITFEPLRIKESSK